MQKKLLQVQEISGQKIVNISGSSLFDLACARKAKFKYIDGAVPESKLSAKFGTAIHHALAEFYKEKPSNRSDSLLVNAFNEVWKEEGDDLRNAETAEKMLRNYWNTFGTDENYEVLVDSIGPVVEREFDVHLKVVDGIQYRLTGTIDLVLKYKETGEIVIMDHKTSKSLGGEFINRYRLNSQMIGYCYAASRLFNTNISRYVINGLQVAKTKQSITRFQGYVNGFQLDQYIKDTLAKVSAFVSFSDNGYFPRALSSECSSYGGCPFLDACSALSDDEAQNFILSIKNGVSYVLE
jgi:hypothetical protein